MPDRTRARELAAEFIRKGDPTGWFEPLYQEAEVGKSTVPWVDLCPNLHLLGFWNAHPRQTIGKSALVIGCGLGDDAEQLSQWGFQTTAFDISETAIRSAKKRYPNSGVGYVAADLFVPPASWQHNFDFVLEIYTLQTLPAALRPPAITKMTEFLRPAGLLLLIARGREPSDP
jgi:2-polyprenyl-3-methyl-5-hydroxy-6-metoxy-1,4-benzoquinol methylase